MPQASPSEIVNNICKEAENFDSKDRLLNFSTKGDFQTPLLLEAGDSFYEKWLKSEGPQPLDAFLPLSQNLTAQQKATTEEQFRTVLREKTEDFLNTDLYLLLGFLKWDGNALAPSILVPLDVSPDLKSLTLSPRGPIENVILRKRLNATVQLPRVEDAIINGKFSILLYFSLFEKAIINEKKWKFTRHGLCLGFFNTNRLLLKKRLERGINAKEADSSKFLNALLGSEGFQFKESAFDEADFDKVFTPADHYFLYPTDSHTTKVTIDALDEKASAFAVQALPGTSKYKVAANIAAESVANNKRTLVVARRFISKLNFNSAFHPAFRSFNGPERDIAEQDLRAIRNSISGYYNLISHGISATKTDLPCVLQEFKQNPAPKAKFPEQLFKSVPSMSFDQYSKLKESVQNVISLYFEKNGLEARKTFAKVTIPTISDNDWSNLKVHLTTAAVQVQSLKPLIDIFNSMGLFPAGIYLSALAEIIDLIQMYFNEETPEFERWELRSNNWIAYRDSLNALPEAGDKWIRYRRQTSDIYTDGAVDENILALREEFAASLKATLKGLSDHYRNAKKQLLKVLKNPKSVSNDAQLLDLIDTLLELQDNKRAYKDTSVLGAHLLGKDWLYEKSDWVELNRKIQYLYKFRDDHQKDKRLDLLLQLLENWHSIKSLMPQMQKYFDSVQSLIDSVRVVSKTLELATPFESLSIDKWVDEIQDWNNNWDYVKVHLQIQSELKNIEQMGCGEIAAFAADTKKVNKELALAVAHYWAAFQMQQATKECPDLLSLSPKERSQKSKSYQTKLDQFCNANFRTVHSAIENDPGLLKVVALDETYSLDNEVFDMAIILDAECITVAEAFSSICIANKVILIGDPHMPSIEPLPYDAYPNILPRQSAFFLENILAAALRKGIPTREIWFSNNYYDINLVEFANEKIYNHGIKQFPMPNREKSKCKAINVVPDKVMEIAKAAILHAEKHPGQTLGIIAFHQARCFEIQAAIDALLTKDSPAARFFEQTNPLIRYFIKTPDRAVDKYRDVVFVCVEVEGNDKISAERKLSICSTLAKQELQVFISQDEIEKSKVATKASLFWDWINYLQKNEPLVPQDIQQTESILRPQVLDLFQSEKIIAEKSFDPAGIVVGPVVVDANNSKRFLAVVEDDCTTERFRESVEDREYIRPTILRQLGWKVLHLWLPFWYLTENDEKDHLVATIAIEQSVAPPPPEVTEEGEVQSETTEEAEIETVQYQVVHPKIEGTPHDKPIAELPAASLISQLKFYVDHESPIHEVLLLQRLLELHHVDRAGPMILQALNDAIKQGIQKQRFIKTGKFFYSTKNGPIALRDRSARPESERKMVYVPPEERALLPASMDDRTAKQTLGILE